MAKTRTAPAPKEGENDQKEQEKQGNGETKAAALPEATDTVKVKIMRSHPALAYAPGEVVDLPRELYDKYLEAGPFYEAIMAAQTTETEE
jgi:hypothetical protein